MKGNDLVNHKGNLCSAKSIIIDKHFLRLYEIWKTYRCGTKGVVGITDCPDSWIEDLNADITFNNESLPDYAKYKKEYFSIDDYEVKARWGIKIFEHRKMMKSWMVDMDEESLNNLIREVRLERSK